MRNLPILVTIWVITACSVSSEQSNAKEELIEEIAEEVAVNEINESDVAPIARFLTLEDSTVLNGYLNELKGIDKFFVKDSYWRLLAIFNKKEDVKAAEVSKLLNNVPTEQPKYYIVEYEPKNGYLAYEPGPVQVFIDMVYWNVIDGSKLIATQSRSCGPVCDMEIDFQIYANGVYKKKQNVIPDLHVLSEKLAPGYDTDIDPYEFEFKLPKQGKDLKYCLGDDCLTLIWNDGSFLLQE